MLHLPKQFVKYELLEDRMGPSSYVCTQGAVRVKLAAVLKLDVVNHSPLRGVGPMGSWSSLASASVVTSSA